MVHTLHNQWNAPCSVAVTYKTKSVSAIPVPFGPCKLQLPSTLQTFRSPMCWSGTVAYGPHLRVVILVHVQLSPSSQISRPRVELFVSSMQSGVKRMGATAGRTDSACEMNSIA